MSQALLRNTVAYFLNKARLLSSYSIYIQFKDVAHVIKSHVLGKLSLKAVLPTFKYRRPTFSNTVHVIKRLICVASFFMQAWDKQCQSANSDGIISTYLKTHTHMYIGLHITLGKYFNLAETCPCTPAP